MIAILPIFLSENDIWHHSKCEDIFFNYLRMIKRCKKIKQRFIFTNDYCVKKNSELLGIKSIYFGTYKFEKDINSVPEGTTVSIKYLREHVNIDFSSLIILNFRNPLITVDLINKAIEKFNRNNKPVLLSVKKSIDHPCQLNTYCQVFDVGFIHMFDDMEYSEVYWQAFSKCLTQSKLIHQYNKESLKITQPFSFNWASRGVYEKSNSGLYIKLFQDVNSHYTPIEYLKDLTEILFPLLIYETNNTARYFFQSCIPSQVIDKAKEQNITLELVGSTLVDTLDSLLIFKNMENNRFYLFINSNNLPPYPWMLRTIPICKNESMKSPELQIRINDSTQIVLYDYDLNKVYGIIYTIITNAQDDYYDFLEPFPDCSKLWDIDNSTGAKINLSTGKKITGRQDFPDVYEPDSTLFIVDKHFVFSLKKQILKGNSDAFYIPATNSILIESELDILRYRAEERIKQNKCKMINFN